MSKKPEKKPPQKKRIVAKRSKVIDALVQTVETQNKKISKLEKRTAPKKRKPKKYLSVHPTSFLQTLEEE